MNNHLSRTLIHVTRVTFRSGGSIQIKVMLRLTRITDTMNTDKLDIMNNATLIYTIRNYCILLRICYENMISI